MAGGYAGPASARSVVVSGLTDGVTYQFKLAARNSVGWGAISNIVSVAPDVAFAALPDVGISVQDTPLTSDRPTSAPTTSAAWSCAAAGKPR